MKYTLKDLNAMMINNGGSLDLSYSKITELPENLVVGDSIFPKNLW